MYIPTFSGGAIRPAYSFERGLASISPTEKTRIALTTTNYGDALTKMNDSELQAKAEEYRVPRELVNWVAENGRLPVPNFSAGGVATPADAALMRQLGAEAVFVGSGIFKSDDPAARGKAIVAAVTHYDDPKALAEVSMSLAGAMEGLELDKIPEEERLARRGI